MIKRYALAALTLLVFVAVTMVCSLWYLHYQGNFGVEDTEIVLRYGAHMFGIGVVCGIFLTNIAGPLFQFPKTPKPPA